jgi:2,3-bisphosphoglycerate-dependent phosphoglycerate mutase
MVAYLEWTYFKIMQKIILRAVLLLSIFIFSTQVMAQTTTIYLVRHAEKDLSDVNTKDPNLNGLGLQRATDLEKILADKNIAAIFSSNYKRTLQTAAPLAQKIKLEPIIYDPSETKLLAEKILREYPGKAVLIVGHSNSILAQTKALGGYPSFTEIKDDDYRNLIRVTINGTDIKTEELKYGN